MLKDQILAAGEIKVEKVSVEGVDLYVRQISYAQRMELEKTVLAEGANGNTLRQQAIMMCTCDKSGKPVFVPEDLPALMSLRHTLIDAIFVEIDRVNGLTAKN